MAETLASATLAVARLVTRIVEGIQTANGSTTTTVDTAMYAPEANNYWNDGTIWFTGGTNIGKTAVLNHTTGWVNATGVFTHTAVTSTVAADAYAVTNADYPRFLLRQCVNRAIRLIGNVAQTDSTIPTVANQEKYTLTANTYNLRRVEIATASATPYYWRVLNHWREENGYLYFDTGYAPSMTGYLLRYWYIVPAAELTTDTGAVSNYIHIDRLSYEAALLALEWRMHQTEVMDDTVKAGLAIIGEEVKRQRYLHPNPEFPKDVHMAKLFDSYDPYNRVDDVGHVTV